MRRWWALIIAVGGSCGSDQGPVLRNAPKPDPNVVAGVAAAAATAATLADPQAARHAEQRAEAARKPGEADSRTLEHRPTVPAGVLDRLDDAARDGGVDAIVDAGAGADAGAR